MVAPSERLAQVFAVYYPDFSHPLSGLTHSDRTIDGLPENLQQLVVRGELYLESKILSRWCKYGQDVARVSALKIGR